MRSSAGRAGRWFQDDKHAAYAAKLLESAEALVLGRSTYEAFAASWPARTGALADRINALPKYVASRTLTDGTWSVTQQPPLQCRIADSARWAGVQ